MAWGALTAAVAAAAVAVTEAGGVEVDTGAGVVAAGCDEGCSCEIGAGIGAAVAEGEAVVLLLVAVSWCSDIVPRLISCPFSWEQRRMKGGYQSKRTVMNRVSQHKERKGEREKG